MFSLLPGFFQFSIYCHSETETETSSLPSLWFPIMWNKFNLYSVAHVVWSALSHLSINLITHGLLSVPWDLPVSFFPLYYYYIKGDGSASACLFMSALLTPKAPYYHYRAYLLEVITLKLSCSLLAFLAHYGSLGRKKMT